MSILGSVFMLLPMLFIFGIFIWQVVWITVDARKANDEYWWAWMILSIVAFPIGVIVYLIINNTNKNKCNYCGKQIRKDMKLCPYCGRTCGYFCGSCGEKVEPEWSFCPKCTNALSQNIINKNEGKSNNKGIFIIVGIIVAFIVVIFLFFIGTVITSYSLVSNVEKYESSISEDSKIYKYNDYIGRAYDGKYTEILSYDIEYGMDSLWIKGNLEEGKIIIRTMDENYDIVSKITIDEVSDFNECIIEELQEAMILDIEFIEFKGEFYIRFD